VIATIWRDWLQPVVMCGCTKRNPDFVCVVEKLLGWKPNCSGLIAILGSAWLQKNGECLIAKSAGLFLWLQKKKKKNWTSVRLQQFGVRDCNQGKCAVAKKNLTLSVWLKKWNLVVWNMIASLGSKWLQKLKVCHCKNCWFISVTAKKEKRNWASVWLQLFSVRDCNQEKCAVAKKRTWLCCVVEKRNLVVWNMIASLGSKWLQKTKVCHCKNCWFISVTAKKRKRKTESVCDCN
jgi:hypothetical protein